MDKLKEMSIKFEDDCPELKEMLLSFIPIMDDLDFTRTLNETINETREPTAPTRFSQAVQNSIKEKIDGLFVIFFELIKLHLNTFRRY